MSKVVTTSADAAAMFKTLQTYAWEFDHGLAREVRALARKYAACFARVEALRGVPQEIADALVKFMDDAAKTDQECKNCDEPVEEFARIAASLYTALRSKLSYPPLGRKDDDDEEKADVELTAPAETAVATGPVTVVNGVPAPATGTVVVVPPTRTYRPPLGALAREYGLSKAVMAKVHRHFKGRVTALRNETAETLLGRDFTSDDIYQLREAMWLAGIRMKGT